MRDLIVLGQLERTLANRVDTRLVLTSLQLINYEDENEAHEGVRNNIFYASEIETLAMDDIGALSSSCASCFETLIRSLRTSSNDFKKQMMPMAIENEYARFKIWAGNLGALQRGQSSLDARLRDSVVLRAAVLKFLGQLQDCLSKSAEITTGLRLPYEQVGDVPHGPDEEIEDTSDTSDTSSELDTGELAERLDEIKMSWSTCTGSRSRYATRDIVLSPRKRF
ncbi:hypothetical protein N7523_004397 [Penicillium sp. IBT 18751x]|nr:hypothetical protein N7523_004397 [Penicillium sp. IBT 18751x]